jgi:hypothetical protein
MAANSSTVDDGVELDPRATALSVLTPKHDENH